MDTLSPLLNTLSPLSHLLWKTRTVRLLLLLCSWSLSAGCLFARIENYKQLVSAKVDGGMRVKVRNWPMGIRRWPNTDPQGHLIMLAMATAPYEMTIAFLDYTGTVDAVRVVEATLHTPDNSWVTVARPKSPTHEGWLLEWQTANGWWVSITGFKRLTVFRVDGLVWDPPQDRPRQLLLTIRFLVRRKPGCVEEFIKQVRLRRVAYPLVCPLGS